MVAAAHSKCVPLMSRLAASGVGIYEIASSGALTWLPGELETASHEAGPASVAELEAN